MLRTALLALGLVTLLGGCSRGQMAATHADVPAAVIPVGVPVLPSIASLRKELPPPRAASYTAEDLGKNGADFEPTLPHQNVTTLSSVGVFHPDWYTPTNMDFAGLSYATYLLQVKGYAGLPTLACNWQTPPSKAGNVYVAVANWHAEHWDWFRGNATYMLNLPGTNDYIDFGGYMLICVMRVGSDDSNLSSLHLGSQPPGVVLQTGTRYGITPLTVGFDASGSTDSDGSIVKYEWDPEGDGIFETSTDATPTFAYEYTAPGIYNAAVRVTDNTGTYGLTSVTVKVVDNVSFTYGSPTENEGVSALTIAGDGSLCVFGNLSVSGSSDVLYFKVEPDGSKGLFAKGWDGGGYDRTYDVARAYDGKLWLTGVTDEDTLKTGKGLVQTWDESGDLLLSTKIASSNSGDGVELHGITTHGSDIYACGKMYLSSVDKYIGLLLRLDQSGQIVWAKSIIAPGDCSLEDVQFQDNQLTGVTSVRVCGWYQGSLSYDTVYGSFTEAGDTNSVQLWGNDSDAEFGTSMFLTGFGNAATYIVGSKNDIANGQAFITRVGATGLDITNTSAAAGVGICATDAAGVTAVIASNYQTGFAGFDGNLNLLNTGKLVGSVPTSQFYPVDCHQYGSGLVVLGSQLGADQPSLEAGDTSIQTASGAWKDAGAAIGSPNTLTAIAATGNVTDHSGFAINVDESPYFTPWIYIGRSAP
jgi:hypothetical protein